MEEKQPSAFQASINPGLVMGLTLIVFSLIMYVIGVKYDSKINWLSYLIIIGFLYWSMTTFRDKSLGGFASYGQVFKAGFFTVLISAILTSIFMYIYVVYINPGLLEEVLMNQEEEILARTPDISDEDLEMAMSMVEKFSSPFMMVIWGFLANVIFGTVFSLIIAIFVRREKTTPA